LKYSKDNCIESIKKAQSKVEGELGANDYRKLEISPSVKTLENKFGSWNKAKKAAGVDTMERGGQDFNHVPFWTHHGKHAFEKWSHRGEKRDRVRIHRLLAVAKFGFDSIKGKIVHHKSHIPWDNRPKNIELMTKSEHQSYHREFEA
jgi:hypothetical protein